MLFVVVVAIFSSCNIDEDITTTMPPEIILDSETGIYTVKQHYKTIAFDRNENRRTAISNYK